MGWWALAGGLLDSRWCSKQRHFYAGACDAPSSSWNWFRSLGPSNHVLSTCDQHLLSTCHRRPHQHWAGRSRRRVCCGTSFGPFQLANLFEEVVKRDPVALGRNIVRVLQNSGQQRDLFDDIVRDGNEKGWFQVGNPPRPIQLPLVQLLRDVATRWDSVYYMVRRLREMHPVSWLTLLQPHCSHDSINRPSIISLLSQ